MFRKISSQKEFEMITICFANGEFFWGEFGKNETVSENHKKCQVKHGSSITSPLMNSNKGVKDY